MENASREMAEVRSRLTIGWDAVSFDVNRRLHALREAIDESDHPEIGRHVPVSAIAALQTMAKGLVIDLVKMGEPYRTRAGGLLKERIAIRDAIEWFHGEAFTFGEVVAHALKFNSITDVHAVVGALLGVDLKRCLASAVDPYKLRNGVKGAPPIVADVDALYRDVEEVFRVRHILAHEAAPNFALTKSDAARMLQSVILLVEGFDAVLWQTAYAHLPLTTYEMNVQAGSELTDAKRRLSEIVVRTLKLAQSAGAPQADWFRKHQERWQDLNNDWFHHTYGQMDGTMWPSVSALEETEAIEARIGQLSRWNASQIGDQVDHPDHPGNKN